VVQDAQTMDEPEKLKPSMAPTDSLSHPLCVFCSNVPYRWICGTIQVCLDVFSTRKLLRLE